ncbi:MAG: HAD family hydrolase [Cellulosilyticaceae bacterium]
MKRILASDIDGTLLIKGNIKTTTLESISELKEAGHGLVLCTGRDFSNTKQVFEKYNLKTDGLVLCNGAFVLDEGFNAYFEQNIPRHVVEKLYRLFNEQEGFYVAYIDGYNTYMDRWPDGIDEMALRVQKVTPCEMKEKFGNIKLISLVVMSNAIEEIEALKNQLNETYGETIVAYRNQVFIDVVPKGCSKASGIEKVAQRLQAEKEQIYVIGDSWNDLSMFEHYPLSFTFNGAEESLKSYVKYTVDSIEECITRILEKE